VRSLVVKLLFALYTLVNPSVVNRASGFLSPWAVIARTNTNCIRYPTLYPKNNDLRKKYCIIGVHRVQIRLNLPSATNSWPHLRQVRLIRWGLGNSGFLIYSLLFPPFLFINRPFLETKKPSHPFTSATRLSLKFIGCCAKAVLLAPQSKYQPTWIIATLRFQTRNSKTRGFPPHPHGWFGFIDCPHFSRMGRYVKGKTRSSDLTVSLNFGRPT
jgi:hypothetical protein